jgi:hypothetical protein
VYLSRAVLLLSGHGIEYSHFYDHPFFGWLFLAGTLGTIGYPDSLHATSDGNVHSIEMLYLAPRVLMGLLAIVDTFLIYKIAERRYNNRNISFIASTLFAVMPMTWITRWILLDTIQLPLLLSSILFAVYAKSSVGSYMGEMTASEILPSQIKYNDEKKRIVLVLLSGVFLGLAIFTKIPAVTMVPLVGYIIYTNHRKSLRTLGLWLLPVILIQPFWPAYAIYLGEFDDWWKSLIYQTTREPLPLFDFKGEQPQNSINILVFKIDPVLMALGFAGLVYSAVRRDFFLLLWIIPLLIFLYFINHVFFYYLLPIFPAFCIAISKFMTDISYRIKNTEMRKILLSTMISGIAIFGLLSTTMLVTTQINSTHLKAAAFLGNHLPSTNPNFDENGVVTLISGERRYFWIFTEVFHKYPVAMHYWTLDPIKTKEVIFVIEDIFDWWSRSEGNKEHLATLLNICNTSQTVVKFNRDTDAYDVNKYPYTSIIPTLGIGRVEIKANAEAASLLDGLVPLKSEPCKINLR